MSLRYFLHGDNVEDMAVVELPNHSMETALAECAGEQAQLRSTIGTLALQR
jgi:hypothetical protein